MTEIQRLTDEIADYLLANNPVWATYVGVHDYDRHLPSLEADKQQEKQRKLSDYLSSLSRALATNLTSNEKLECQILSGMLTSELVELEQYQSWNRNPLLPLEIASFGAMMLVTREFAPLEERLESLAERLAKVPQLLEEAKSNLSEVDEVPTVWAEMAEDGCRDAAHYFGELLPQLGADIPTVAEKLSKAGERAARACDSYYDFLKEKLTSRSKGSYALGRQGFERLVRDVHALGDSLEEISQFGMNAITATLVQMDRLAEQIQPGAGHAKVIADIKEKYAAGDDVVQAYADEMARTRQFVIDKELATMPPGGELSVVETPEYKRSTLPFAAYVPPAAFEENHRGVMWVTPINADASSEEQAQQRRGHNRYSMMLIALHEGYPGHHLQHIHAFKSSSRIRKLASSTLFAEGWALYCEQLMAEQGYYAEPEARLMQLVHELWRACRVVIDVGLHTGEMSFSEAVAMLVQIVGADPVNAIAEVKRYSYTPSQPLSYLLGKRELLSLRDEAKERQGGEFDLRGFHDRLLSYGRVPFAYLREPLLEQIGDMNR